MTKVYRQIAEVTSASCDIATATHVKYNLKYHLTDYDTWRAN